MTNKMLSELRADWRRENLYKWGDYYLVTLTFSLMAAGILRTTLAVTDVTLGLGEVGRAYILAMSNWTFLLVVVAIVSVLFILVLLAYAGPYPSIASFELTTEIRCARAAARTDTGCSESENG